MSTIRRSAIWNVFTETHKEDFIATCNICSQEFSYRSTTTNLMKHLQRKHPAVSVDLNSSPQKQNEGMIQKEVEIVIERQLENECQVKSFKVEVQPVAEQECNFIVLNSGSATSSVWDFFSKIQGSDSVASCNICHKEFSYKTTTTNLKKHLDRKHPEQLAVSDETNCKFVVYNSDEENDENILDNMLSDSHEHIYRMWNCFAKIQDSDSIASCKICNKEFSYKTSTLNLERHLKMEHPLQLPESDVTDCKLVVFNSDEDQYSSHENNFDVPNSSKQVSLMWKYFTKISDSSYMASCNFCTKEISYKTSTSNLKRHLNRKHSQEFLLTGEKDSKIVKYNSDQKLSNERNYFCLTRDTQEHKGVVFNSHKVSYMNEDTDLNCIENTNDNYKQVVYNTGEEGGGSIQKINDETIPNSRRYVSAMWNYFKKIPNSESTASCNICHQEFSYKTSVSNLKKHLERKHLYPSDIQKETNNLIIHKPALELPKYRQQVFDMCPENNNKMVIYNSDEKMSVKNSRRNASLMWCYFTKIEDSNSMASCNICRQKFSYKTSVSNLRIHLKRKHIDEFEAINKGHDTMIVYDSDQGSDTYKLVIYDSDKERISEYLTDDENVLIPTKKTSPVVHMDQNHQISESIENNSDVITISDKESEAYEDDMLVNGSSSNNVLSTHKHLSRVWDFFTKIQPFDSIASCNFCHKHISYKSTITNLQIHINTTHPEQLETENTNQTVCNYIVSSSSGESHHTIGSGYEECDSDTSEGENYSISERHFPSFDKKEVRMWTFFTKIPLSNCMASCNICSKILSYESSTSNLQKHLIRQHSSNDKEEDTDEEIVYNNKKHLTFISSLSNRNNSSVWSIFRKIPNSDFIAMCKLCEKQISYRTTTNYLQMHIVRRHPKYSHVIHQKNILSNNTYKDSDLINKSTLIRSRLNSGKIVSPLWSLFTKIPSSDCLASCNICRKEFSYKTTTGNLKKHIDRKHHEQLLNVSQIQDQVVYQEEPQLSDSREDHKQKLDQHIKILAEETAAIYNTENNANHQIDNSNDIDNDFWNNLDNSDEDPDFRPSPTFEDEIDIKNTSSGKKRSQIWNVFTEKPMSDWVAICNVCNQEFCYRSTTNNLKKHFQRKHPNLTFESKIERVIEPDIDEQAETKPAIDKNFGDDEDRESSDEAVCPTGGTKRKRSQIWNYFTRKKPGEYTATCNICKKELGFRSTTSNLKKHLDRKHPHIEMKLETEVDQKKSEPEVVVKTCLICLQNDQTEPREFLLVNHSDSDEKNYMTKIQEIMNQTVVIDESHVICRTCVDDLEKVLQFKDKISKAFEFWSKVESEQEAQDNCTEDANQSDYSDLEDGESLAKFTCNKCNKVFPSPSIMLKHNCGQLLKKFKSQIRRDVADRDTRFYCELCGRSFNIKWKLNKHLKRCQSNANKQFVCTLCDRVFKKAYHLREHMASHTGERNYSCNLCGKTFQRSSSKHKHMRSHNAKPGEKSKKTPFLCTICGKSFPYSNGASRHMRVHLGERRHQCHICLKRFSQTTHLKVHLRTHSGERPYGCVICGRTFSLNASLRKHMRLHVGSGDFVKLLPAEIVTEDGMHVLTAVQEIEMEDNQCIA